MKLRSRSARRSIVVTSVLLAAGLAGAACSSTDAPERAAKESQASLLDGGAACEVPSDPAADYLLLPMAWQFNPTPCTSGVSDNCSYDAYCAAGACAWFLPGQRSPAAVGPDFTLGQGCTDGATTYYTVCNRGNGPTTGGTLYISVDSAVSNVPTCNQAARSGGHPIGFCSIDLTATPLGPGDCTNWTAADCPGVSITGTRGFVVNDPPSGARLAESDTCNDYMAWNAAATVACAPLDADAGSCRPRPISDGGATDGATTDGATTDAATSDGATDGATTDGATADGGGTGGDGGSTGGDGGNTGGDGGNTGGDGGSTGADGGNTSGDGGSTSGDGGNTSGDGGSTSGDGGNTSGDGGSTSGDGGSTSGDGGNTSGDGGSTSGDGGNTSGDGGNTSGDGGNTSGDGGNTSGDGGNTSGDGGSTSGDGGNTSGDGGSTSGDGGSTTADGGASGNGASSDAGTLEGGGCDCSLGNASSSNGLGGVVLALGALVARRRRR